MKLNNFIVCDMIRQENTNKRILIGIYDETLIVVPQPSEKKVSHIGIPLAFFIRFILSDENEVKPESFKFTISFDVADQPPVEFKGELKKDKGRIIIIGLSFNTLLIPYNTKRIDFKICLFYADGNKAEFNLDSLKFIVSDIPSIPKVE
jgi:hypothetical protein